jgi:uncharacterized protein YjbI with pentapeptide repeats
MHSGARWWRTQVPGPTRREQRDASNEGPSVLVSERDNLNSGALPTRKNLKAVSATRVLTSEPNACDVATVVARLERGERNCAKAKLAYARFSGIALRWVILDGADLRGACFDDCDLSFASLRGANLAGASFQGAILDTAILQEAVLREADLRGANLARATLTGVDLCHAVIDAATIWPHGFDPSNGGAFLLGTSKRRTAVPAAEPTCALTPQRDSGILGPLEYDTGDFQAVPDSRGSRRGMTRWLGNCSALGGPDGLADDVGSTGSSFDASYDDDGGLESVLAEPLTRLIPAQPISRVIAPRAWRNPTLSRKQPTRRK